MNNARLLWLVLLTLAFSGRAAEDSRGVLEQLFRPGGITHMALSPDGRNVAYTVSGLQTLTLVIVDVETGRIRTTLPLEDPKIRPRQPQGVAVVPATIFLQWANPRQLVYAWRHHADAFESHGDVRIVDADGKNDRLLFNEEHAGYRMLQGVVGFAADHPDRLVVDVMRNQSIGPAALFSVDVTTGKNRLVERQTVEGRMIYDRQGRPRLLETPGVDLRKPGLHWSQVKRQRYLLKAGERARDWQDIDLQLESAGPTFAHGIEDYFEPRSIPLSFDRDPNILYFASNVGRDTFGIYALDLRTKRRTTFAMEDPRFDLVELEKFEAAASPLIYDRQHKMVGVRVPGVPSRTRWIEPKLARVQEQLNARFPGRGVELLDWDVELRRVVALVTGPGEPGRYFLFDEVTPNRMKEIAGKTPWLTEEVLNPAEPFEFVTAAGVTLSGSVTWPRQPLVKRPPLVVLCPDLPAWRDHGGFARDAQALAAAGFAVLKVDYRGISGFGRERRDAAKEAVDRVPLDDLRAAIDWLASRQPFDRSRIALVGRQFGGYLALRALQLYPNEFRAAVTFDAPFDLGSWVMDGMTGPIQSNLWFERITFPGVFDRRRFFGSDRAKLDALSPLRHTDALTRPVLIFENVVMPGRGQDLFQKMREKGVAAEFVKVAIPVRSLPGDGYAVTDGRRTTNVPVIRHQRPEPGLAIESFYESAEAFSRVNAFLTAHLYDFDVKIGPEKPVP